MDKIKVGVFQGSACGGCDVALLDLHEEILRLIKIADIEIWPFSIDFKHEKIEKLEDKSIDFGIYHGLIITSENEKIAHIARKKVKYLISFGACACFGGVPGLFNVASKEEILETVYVRTASTKNEKSVLPSSHFSDEGKELTLPNVRKTALALRQVVDVDYYVPGCPPTFNCMVEMLDMMEGYAQKKTAPPKGKIFASDKPLCDDCPRVKEEKSINEISRVHKKIPDDKKCLLEQGILCLGPSTRSGCGHQCINANMPCRGCFGPLSWDVDQGAKMLSALASILMLDNEKEVSENDIEKGLESLVDPLGTFYRFTFPIGIINRNFRRGMGK